MQYLYRVVVKSRTPLARAPKVEFFTSERAATAWDLEMVAVSMTRWQKAPWKTRAAAAAFEPVRCGCFGMGCDDCGGDQ